MLLLLLACVPPAPSGQDTTAPPLRPEDSAAEGPLTAELLGGIVLSGPDSHPPDSPGDSEGSDSQPDSVRLEREPIVVFAVRHAEKDSGSDPSLTEAGHARADALRLRLADEPLSAVYATTLKRTQETVEPTAQDHGLEIRTELHPEEELAAWILAQHPGEVVLHAGHSYTLGGFLDAIGAEDAPGVSGYGQLWVLHIDEEGVKVEMEHFGD